MQTSLVETLALGYFKRRFGEQLVELQGSEIYRLRQLHRRVFLQFFTRLRVGQELLYIGGREQLGLFEDVGGVFRIVALVFLIYFLENIGQILRGDTLFGDSHHRAQHFLVERRLIILEEGADAVFHIDFALVGRRAFGVKAIYHDGEAGDFRSVHQRLAEVGHGVHVFAGRGVAVLQEVEYFAVFLLSRSIFCYPIGESLLLSLLAGNYVEAGKSLVHTDGVLPIVRAAGILRGILDTDGIAGRHRLGPDVLLDSAHFDTRFVAVLDALLNAPRREIAVRAAGETNCHRVVLLLIALERDFGNELRLVRLVVGAIFRRLVLSVGIDTEHGEVYRMPGPHPVVRIPTELTHGRRRGKHHAHIAEDIVSYQVILIVGIEGDDIRTLELIRPDGVAEHLTDRIGCRHTLSLIRIFLQLRHDAPGNINRLVQIADG